LKIKKIIALLVCFFILALSLSACTPEEEPSKQDPPSQAKSYYEYFDTVSAIFSYKGDAPQDFAANCEAVKNLLEEYHQLFDIYYEYSGVNNIKTINKNAGIAPVTVDAKLIDFLVYCKDIYTLTGGETNIALGSVLKLWHDARENAEYDPSTAAIPSPEALTEAAKHTDINNLIINKEERTVYLADPQMRLDVGAIAKGYATEKAAQLLISRGVTSYVLNFGGNIRAIGKKVSGNGWITGITNPNKESTESFACRVSIKDLSLVTSGDYERFYYVNGEKYHHIIDKDTNMPSAFFSSVSVFTKDSGLADALSTALFCMSYEEGLALVEQIGGIDVLWIYHDGSMKMTNGVSLVND
jgi:thiamine biosynthesis lipoprotein